MRLRVTLKSDLCAYGGEGFAGGVDADVVSDGYGLPFLPARRLKGLLRDAAEYIEIPANEREGIFGRKGSSFGGALMLANAYLPGYAKIVQDLRAMGDNAPETSEVLSLFTYTRAQTAIEGDTAKEGSLRLTRVLKQFSPLTNRELTFYADAECAGYEEQMQNICKALRNMGLMRTRGLGAVECGWEQEPEEFKASTAFPKSSRCRITYTVWLRDSLMISGLSNEESLDYIAGVNVLGTLARLYKQSNPEGKEFEELFLGGKVIASNLYPVTDKCRRMVPAPLFLGKQKSKSEELEEQLENLLEEHPDKSIKPVKSGYILTEGTFKVHNVKLETVYHHARKPEPVLYTQTCICAGQAYGGYLECDTAYAPLLWKLLCKDDLRFGRSKTAQYSKCRIIQINAEEPTQPTILFNKSEIAVLVLESDLLLIDEYGTPSVSTETLESALKTELKLSSTPRLTGQSVLRSASITGYNAKWNLRKPMLRVFQKGSVLVFPMPEEKAFSRIIRIGARQFEGYGELRFYTQGEISARFQTSESYSSQQSEPFIPCDGLNAILKLIEEKREVQAAQDRAISCAEENNDRLCLLSASFLGRLLLMMRQATDYTDFLARVNSVKDEQGKQIALYFVQPEKENPHWRQYLHTIFTFGKYYVKDKELSV